ncbi:hypothetical protein HMPREF1051_1581 [Neisseria sicca VK64]|uniref:Uncharacterized protein n=1 Tax=Neisseria sicca VK64 TaxID=1095748 RepID=I2NTM3_NEISI|nr:hypothetical protein HMPREF1051_1581 [Neisseria sicca VK64]
MSARLGSKPRRCASNLKPRICASVGYAVFDDYYAQGSSEKFQATSLF